MSVEKSVLSRFNVLYGDPKTPDMAAFSEEYVKALKGYDPDVLTTAVDRTIGLHQYQTWPVPGEIKHHCQAILKEQNAAAEAERKRKRQPDEPLPERTPEQLERASRLVEELAKSTASLALKKEPVKAVFYDRDQFEKMQRESPNKHHRNPEGLTDLSKRMTGEAAE